MARASKTRASRADRKTARPACVPESGGAKAEGPIERCAALLDGYLESLAVEQNASGHTVRAYRTDVEQFLRWCGRAGVDPLAATYRQLRGYLAEMDAAQYTRKTVNRRLSSVRGFYGWLMANGVVDSEPASVIVGPKQNKHLPHVLKGHEMDRLLEVHAAFGEGGETRERTPKDMRDQALLELLYACGLRISEAAALDVADVDFASGLVRVMGKGRKERIVPLHDLCRDALRDYMRNARPQLLGDKRTDRLFVSTRGNPMSADALRRVFKAAVREAGLDETLSPHDMRHTFATDLLDGDADLRSVQEMLGHARLSTTQVYTHLSATRLKDVHGQAHPRA